MPTVVASEFFTLFLIDLMLSFFYDSLDTLKKVRKPTSKEVTELTVIIFVVVIVSAIIFAAMDGVFGELYRMFYAMMTGV